MVLKNLNNYCNICNGSTHRVSTINNITKKTKHSWESDSSVEILNLNEVNCFLGFCSNCFLTTIYPKFNTDLIYNAKSVEIRKKHYEIYNPDKTYDEVSNDKSLKSLFNLTKNELNRFKNVCKVISKIIKNKNIDNYSILDYGGGDGYIAKIFALLIETVSKIKVNFEVYDFSKMEESKNSKILEEKKFDLIILSHIIEHTHEPKLIINKIKNYLKSDGMVYCEVPDERLNILKAFLTKKVGLHYHVTHHTRRSIHKLFEDLKFQNIKTNYFWNSSYRGNKLRSIVGVAQNNNSSEIKKNKEPKRIYELLSFFWLIIFVIFFKIKSKIN